MFVFWRFGVFGSVVDPIKSYFQMHTSRRQNLLNIILICAFLLLNSLIITHCGYCFKYHAEIGHACSLINEQACTSCNVTNCTDEHEVCGVTCQALKKRYSYQNCNQIQDLILICIFGPITLILFVFLAKVVVKSTCLEYNEYEEYAEIV